MLNAHKSIALIAIAGALGFAGCGDDEETPTSTESVETGSSGATGASGATALPADFAEEANQICADGEAALEEPDFQGEPSQKQIESFVTDGLVPNIQAQIDDIRALDPPSEGADELTAFLDHAQAELDDLQADPSTIDQAFDGVDAEAEALGLDECAD